MDTADAIPVDNQVNILTYITQLYSARAQVAAQISSASLKAPDASDYAWLYQVPLPQKLQQLASRSSRVHALALLPIFRLVEIVMSVSIVFACSIRYAKS